MQWSLGLFFLTLVGCSSTDPVTKSPPPHGTQIINLGAPFGKFWQKAKGLPFAEQEALWREWVEAPRQEFYDSLVWTKSTRPDWSPFREKQLREAFKVYSERYESIEASFRTFDSTLQVQIRRFHALFPDARFDLDIYAIPSALTFNGKGGSLASSPKITIMAFGLDQITEGEDDLDTLFSHELFHLYHASMINVSEDRFNREGRMTLLLWMEGLATYVSGELNPYKSDAELLMNEALGRQPKSELAWLARAYLGVADERANDLPLYRKWFAGSGESVTKDSPNRSGYLLGLHVVRHLAKTHSLNEMMHWDLPMVHAQVPVALRALGSVSE
ncbi:MAG: hypothetical protein JST16_19005 [Bdellovibrionales bacterium]|nr:hypothetical protein [Bdellovibrionales bacterium]